MYRLEYRLWQNDAEQNLYYYDDLTVAEMNARLQCEFFVKQGTTYKTLSTMTNRHMTVIYVEQRSDELVEKHHGDDGILVELVDWQTKQSLTKFPCASHDEAALWLASDEIEWQQHIYERDSAEVDEDRGLYVIYVAKEGK